MLIGPNTHSMVYQHPGELSWFRSGLLRAAEIVEQLCGAVRFDTARRVGTLRAATKADIKEFRYGVSCAHLVSKRIHWVQHILQVEGALFPAAEVGKPPAHGLLRVWTCVRTRDHGQVVDSEVVELGVG